MFCLCNTRTADWDAFWRTRLVLILYVGVTFITMATKVFNSKHLMFSRIWLSVIWHHNHTAGLKLSDNNNNYYSFKIFPQFWLAKSTRIIHHNQLLMTKCARILCLTRKWRQKCSLLQVNAPLTKRTWGRGWVVFIVKTKMADTSIVSRVRTTAGTRRNNC